MQTKINTQNGQKKILIVDDDEDIVSLVSILLKMKGFSVCSHNNGLNVDAVVDKCQPDLVLLDVGLPGKYGDEVCAELKQMYSIPVILFSAHANLRKCQQECHAEAFISKPFDIHVLVDLIKAHA